MLKMKNKCIVIYEGIQQLVEAVQQDLVHTFSTLKLKQTFTRYTCKNYPSDLSLFRATHNNILPIGIL